METKVITDLSILLSTEEAKEIIADIHFLMKDKPDITGAFERFIGFLEDNT